MKGWIALDIDGTITDDTHSIPDEVSVYLQSLASSGWRIIFITGRTFSFGQMALKGLHFPHYLALQNGSDILQMPGKKLIARNYLRACDVIPILEEMYRGQGEDYLIYAGYEQGDFCYWRPHRFSSQMQNYLRKFQVLCPEPWKAVDHFDFDDKTVFPLIKCLGSKEAMEKVNARISSLSEIETTLIRDPLSDNLYLILITDARATKGNALDTVIDGNRKGELIIAAGDDLNDLSMLRTADIGIAMESAPELLRKEADIIAPRASGLGIIKALKQAVLLFLLFWLPCLLHSRQIVNFASSWLGAFALNSTL